MATHFSIITRKIHGQRSRMGYSPWDGKESDTTEVTEHVCTHTHTVQATLPSLSHSPIPPTLTQMVLHTLPLCSYTTQTECSTKVIFTPHGNCQSLLKGPSATQGQGPHLSPLYPSANTRRKWQPTQYSYLAWWTTVHGVANSCTWLSDSHFSLSPNTRGLPGGASGKEPACQCRGYKRHMFDPWIGKIPWRRA